MGPECTDARSGRAGAGNTRTASFSGDGDDGWAAGGNAPSLPAVFSAEYCVNGV